MSRILLMFAAVDTAAISRWVLLDGNSCAVVRTGEGMPEGPGTAALTVLILPGQQVTTTRCELPRRITSQVRAAVPQLLADQLAVSDAGQHFAIGPAIKETVPDRDTIAGSGRVVALVDKACLTSILGTLQVAGLTPDLAVADYMLLPDEPQTAHVVETDGAILIGLPDAMGAALEPAIAATTTRNLLNDDLEKVIWHGTTAGDCLPDGQLPSARLELQNAMHDQALWTQYGQAAQRYAGPNLLQGDMKGRVAWRLSLPRWRRTASLVAVAASLLVLLFLVQGWQMNRQAAATDRKTLADMQAVFPGTRTVHQLRARVRQLQTRESDQFLTLSAALFAALDDLEAVYIDQMQYDSRQKQLLVRLKAGDLTVLEAVKKEIGTLNTIDFTERSSRQKGQIFETSFTMEFAS